MRDKVRLATSYDLDLRAICDGSMDGAHKMRNDHPKGNLKVLFSNYVYMAPYRVHRYT